MNVKLSEICDVQLGYAFRRKLDQDANGNLAVIQMKDLTSHNTVDTSDISKIQHEGMKPHHFVKKWDLVFRSRGLDTSTALLLENIENCVVAAPLYVFRVKDHARVHPPYLNWVISHPKTQSFLRSRTEGSNQKMVSKQVLEHLSIPLPTYQQQQQISEINQLAEREAGLLSQIRQKKQALISAVLHNYAEGDNQ